MIVMGRFEAIWGGADWPALIRIIFDLRQMVRADLLIRINSCVAFAQRDDRNSHSADLNQHRIANASGIGIGQIPNSNGIAKIRRYAGAYANLGDIG